MFEIIKIHEECDEVWVNKIITGYNPIYVFNWLLDNKVLHSDRFEVPRLDMIYHDKLMNELKMFANYVKDWESVKDELPMTTRSNEFAAWKKPFRLQLLPDEYTQGDSNV